MNKGEFLRGGGRVAQASAPGRLDVMGGFADYSGSLVLEMPIRESTECVVSLRKDHLIRVFSANAARLGLKPLVTMDTRALPDGKSRPLSFLAELLESTERWALYAIGCVIVLCLEKRIPFPALNIFIDSDVPSGRGVSASAALEVSVMRAVCRLLCVEVDPVRMAVLCRKAENEVALAPCGIMDQLTCVLGRKDRLLPILCRPHEVGKPLAIPRGLHFVGIDTGFSHQVSGASYTDVRVAAFMGYSLIAKALGVSPARLARAAKTGDHAKLPFGGWLAAIPPSVLESEFSGLLPDRLSGRRFQREVKTTLDTATQVNPLKSYRVGAAVRHPVMENFRVQAFIGILRGMRGRNNPDDAGILGELMYQSHASYNACGLGAPAAESLVDRVRRAGPEKGVFGAKLTGGGSGGTVCVLCLGRQGLETAAAVAKLHAREWKVPLRMFKASGEGAVWRRAEG